MPINTNLRFLRVTEDGYSMRRGLCEACGQSGACSSRNEAVNQCHEYQPVLLFKSMAGTEDVFNTFRLGKTWPGRVEPGQLVGLIDKHGEKTGEAVVQFVLCGPKDQMLDEHAACNHLMIASGHPEPAVDLKRQLRNLYGTNFLARAELLSVIYLKRYMPG